MLSFQRELLKQAEGQTIVLGKQGGMLVAGEGHEVVEPPHPLEPFGDVVYQAGQVHRLVHQGNRIYLFARQGFLRQALR